MIETKGEGPRAAEVQAQIYALLRQVKDIDEAELTPETAFKSLGLSSLDVLALAFELEDRFGIAIRDAYLDDFRTVREATETVLALIAKLPA